ncbi:non-heme iron oxygenase ferredoxin subunit [Candidatus Gottesmanbacteria bacterium]|nr:non-heme iron oxygenase ferredoxin subunit [Candidatus Gottesmanbacteria bacterium]
MAEFTKIAITTDIPNGKMKAFSIGGKLITIANTDGEYLAFDDTCTHAQCSLAGGFLDGYTLTCYCHGGQYDIKSGEVLAPPPPSPLGIYNVKVEGDEILVEI